MKSNIKVPIFIPHLGCENDCVFCNQVKITGCKSSVDTHSIEKLFVEYTSHVKDKSEVEIAFFGGSFTGIEESAQIEYLDAAKALVLKHNLKGIRMSTRPDYINVDVMNRLENYPISAIELGVQSMDNDVLTKAKRGHSAFDVYHAVQLIKKYDIRLGVQMMFDLPGDTKETSILTAKKLIKMKPDFVRLYPTLVLKDTELEQLYKNGKYIPWDSTYMIDTLTEVYKLFLRNRIAVIRVGLHSSDAEFLDSVIAGYYHPALREVILSNMFKTSLDRVLTNHDVIEVNKKEISNVVGISSSNKKYFHNKGITFKVKATDMEELHYKINGRVHCIYDTTES